MPERATCPTVRGISQRHHQIASKPSILPEELLGQEDNDLLETLRAVSIFSECTDSDLERLAAILAERSVPAGVDIYKEGDPSTEFYILLSGEAEYRRKSDVWGIYRQGQTFGETALISGEPRIVTVRTTTDVTIGVLSREQFEDLLIEVPIVARKLLYQIAVQYCWISGRATDLESQRSRMQSQEKLAALGILTAGVAHEVRNPLTFIKNFTEAGIESARELGGILADTPGTEDRDLNDYIADIDAALANVGRHVQRIESIVAAILQYSQGSLGNPVSTDVGELVRRSIDLGYEEFKSAGRTAFTVRMRISTEQHVVAVVFQHEMERAIVNLVTNACASMWEARAISPGLQPELDVSVFSKNGRVGITVRDNGGGISEEHLARVFDPFFTTKQPGEGTGLGLWLCYDTVVGHHGGELTVKSEPGTFAEFAIVLPRGPMSRDRSDSS
jgi:signal transduction histidine kinase